MRMARMISERYPDIDHVDVEMSLDFQTWVCPTKPEEHKFPMKPEHKNIFTMIAQTEIVLAADLTSALEEYLRSKHDATGTLRCNGKEDAKYEHASGCSCMTTCIYKFTLVMK